MGDPAGVGPEIIAAALLRDSVRELCRPLVVGDAGAISRAAALFSPVQEVHAVGDVADALFQKGVIDVWQIPQEHCPPKDYEWGKVSEKCGDAAFVSVRTAIGLAMAGKVDGTVTAPLNKEALNKAGHHFDGHTEIYAHFTGTKKYAMFLADEHLKVIHVSTHVSLREACDRVKKARIIEVAELLHDALEDFGIANPRIGVAGLNPHASDGGLFGWEEQQEIIPAVEELRGRGWSVAGPVSPDALYAQAKCGRYDGVVAMYHDQGHIPFKVLGFDWDPQTGKMSADKGVNITLGLPIIRVSVDHGTAFDVAGKGIASAEGLVSAIEYAALMAVGRRKRL